MTKDCSLCGLTLPLDSFSVDRRNTVDGRQSRCKPCKAGEQRAYRKRDPAKDRECQRRSRVKRVYGLTPDEVDRRVEEQGGRCYVCNGEPGGRYNVLCVDHDHETGAVRQLLCYGCNTALGAAKDNPEVLRRLADYLEQHR